MLVHNQGGPWTADAYKYRPQLRPKHYIPSTSDPSRVRGGMHYSVKIQNPRRAPVGVTTVSVWTPRRCDILTSTPTGPAPPGPDPMLLVTDTSAACLRTVTVCVHVLPATGVISFSDLPQIGDRVSTNIIVTESTSHLHRIVPIGNHTI